MDFCRSTPNNRDLLSIIRLKSQSKNRRVFPRVPEASEYATHHIPASNPTPSSPINPHKRDSISPKPLTEGLFDVQAQCIASDFSQNQSPLFDHLDHSLVPTPIKHASQPLKPSRSPLSELPPVTYPAERRNNFDSSSDDDRFETLLANLRQKSPPKLSRDSSSSFLTDTSSSGSETIDGPLFYYQVDNHVRSTHRSPVLQRRPLNLGGHNPRSELRPPFQKPQTVCPKLSYDVRPARSPSPHRTSLPTDISASRRPVVLDFVYSLYSFDDEAKENMRHTRHPSAERFVKHFKANRHELARRLFHLFNEKVFENKLPKDMELTWNSRLVKTAGQCKYLRREVISTTGDRTVTRLAQIELSPKVCTTAERVRDTLLHEACHAAVWIVNGVNDGHGQYWRSWAGRALRVWPKLPMVSVCHGYSIDTRFTYRCTGCGHCVNRHSKSIDVNKKVCGSCHSRFELLLNTPHGRLMRPSVAGSMDKRLLPHCLRTNSETRERSSPTTPVTGQRPPPFAEFVRTNYKDVRRRPDVKSHADAMSTLGTLFKSMRLTASSCNLTSSET